jgi:hypothetical protein
MEHKQFDSLKKTRSLFLHGSSPARIAYEGMGWDQIQLQNATLAPDRSDYGRFQDRDIHIHFLFVHGPGSHALPARTGILIARASN